jgi:hypothetical protein
MYAYQARSNRDHRSTRAAEKAWNVFQYPRNIGEADDEDKGFREKVGLNKRG